MKPRRFLAMTLIALCVGALLAQDGPQQGRIKKLDADKNTVVVTSDGKDLALEVTADTRVMSAGGKQIDNLFKDKAFKEGAEVLFKRDGQKLIGIKLQEDGGGKQPKDGGNVQRGTLVKIDLDKLIVTLKAGDKEIEAVATDNTQFPNIRPDMVKEKLAKFKPGADVQFMIQTKDGKNYLAGMRRMPVLVKVDASKLVPIDELGAKEYKDGFKGGFYPDGKNTRPKEHEAAGLKIAQSIRPLDTAGKPDPNGKIVMLSVGMSNTAQASAGFQRMLREATGINPKFLFVNGAVGGQTAAITQSTETKQGAKYWAEVDQRLKNAGSSREQVQIIWIKQADGGPDQGFPDYAKELEAELANLVKIFPKRFPNARLVYLSSRTYGGYATTPLNPEPYAYESAFSVKWLIERQIKGEAELNFDPKKGEVKAPWLSWGPYLWANGSTKRAADGFSYEREDFDPKDGTHHSQAGSDKIGRLMVRFFESDTTTRPWFMSRQKHNSGSA